MPIYPCARGSSDCSMCSVEMPWHWSGLCEHCRAETPCRKCGEILKEYMNVELCERCYLTEPFRYRLIPKRRIVCLPKSQ